MTSCTCLFREATSSEIDEGENLETLIFTSLSRDILSGDFVAICNYRGWLTNQKYQSKTQLEDKCFNSTDESRIYASFAIGLLADEGGFFFGVAVGSDLSSYVNVPRSSPRVFGCFLFEPRMAGTSTWNHLFLYISTYAAENLCWRQGWCKSIFFVCTLKL
jgi:hypothetical protein